MGKRGGNSGGGVKMGRSESGVLNRERVGKTVKKSHEDETLESERKR